MKRGAALLSLAMLAYALLGGSAAQAQESNAVTVYFNGTAMTFEQSPVLRNGTTMVPFRALFEQLGYAVSWNEKERAAVAKRYSTVVTLRLDSNLGTVNQEQYLLAEQPQLENGTTYVPLRFIAEASGAIVRWNDENRSVLIDSPDKLGREEQIRNDLQRYGYSVSLNEFVQSVLHVNGAKMNQMDIIGITHADTGTAVMATYRIEYTVTKKALNGESPHFANVTLEITDRAAPDEAGVWRVDASSRTWRVVKEEQLPVSDDNKYIQDIMTKPAASDLTSSSPIEDIVVFIKNSWKYGTSRKDIEAVWNQLGLIPVPSADGLISRADLQTEGSYEYNGENGLYPDIDGLRKGVLRGQVWMEWDSSGKLKRLDMYWTGSGDHREPKHVFTYGVSMGGTWY